MLSVRLEDGRVEVHEAPLPPRPPGFALLRMLCAGICNTDLELQRGYYGFAGVPGHEFVGDVVAADSADLIGRRVVGKINLSCCACEWCKRDLGRHCPHRTITLKEGETVFIVALRTSCASTVDKPFLAGNVLTRWHPCKM